MGSAYLPVCPPSRIPKTKTRQNPIPSPLSLSRATEPIPISSASIPISITPPPPPPPPQVPFEPKTYDANRSSSASSAASIADSSRCPCSGVDSFVHGVQSQCPIWIEQCSPEQEAEDHEGFGCNWTWYVHVLYILHTYSSIFSS
ncbi:uncharacterized protein C1orf198 homolog isoform X1 [Asparagus officinalis]|uniref:uncharacterized protein C1orf198 homolog isoform X1 n=1 Tax=Asparagus officinalis TaxID=4686 RepID=UPI00098E07C9|nr:uncharacterized protein C1orf198 homolog isoform X1 [Asparagus officinalis]